MPQDSPSDHIGRIGENYVQNLAEKARLLVVTPIPDRIGKDRLIEFQLAPKGEYSYDTRLPPLACSIQIKTIFSKNTKVAISLSVAERLIGDQRPSFVCIVRLDNDDEPVDLHLVHLIGDNLGRVQKRLRKAYSDNISDLNKSRIYFDIKSGRKVDLSPAGLKHALMAEIGQDMDAYARKKERQRKTVGFPDQERITGKVTFNVESNQELVDGFLGLTPLPVSAVKVFETRFGIKLPHPVGPHGLNDGIMTVDPTPSGTGYLCFSETNDENVSKVPCEFIFPGMPGLPIELLKWRAKADTFELIFTHQQLDFAQASTIENSTILQATQWQALLEVKKLISSGEFKLSVYDQQNELMFSSASSGQAVEFTNYYDLVVMRRLNQLMKEANYSQLRLAFDQIPEIAESINLIYGCFIDPSLIQGPMSFKLTCEIPTDVSIDQFLWFYTVPIGTETMMIAVKLNVNAVSDGDQHHFTSTRIQGLQIEMLGHRFDTFETFQNSVTKLSGIAMSIVHSTMRENSV